MSIEDVDIVLKVAAASDARKVGSAVAHSVTEGKNVSLRCVGAGSVNQAQKAVAIANSWSGPKGYLHATIPGFADIPAREGGGKTISAMTFRVVKI